MAYRDLNISDHHTQSNFETYKDLKENDYSQGIDLLRRAVFAFMSNKEYENAKEVLHTLEDIDVINEPSDKLQELAIKMRDQEVE